MRSRVKTITCGAWVLLGVVLVAIGTPRATFAQGTSAARVVGVVKDTSDAVLPGVTVSATSPALTGVARTVVTDAKGQFTLAELPTGTYTVTVSLSGFKTFKREGLELPPNFTATVNVNLSPGGVEETVTVSGQTPLVDVASMKEQTNITSDMLSALPTGKSHLAFAALVPSAINPGTAQDVGGSMGELSVRISVHGSKQTDQKLLQDGLDYTTTGANGTGRTYLVNPLASQEVIVDLGAGGSAEYPFGGATVNLIPRDGTDNYSGTIFAGGTTHALQSNNLTSDLMNRGLTSVNTVRDIYDFNGVFGGPIERGKLWFMVASRAWGRRAGFANLYAALDPSSLFFTPDLNNPGEAGEDYRAYDVRATWQASQKNRFAFSYDYQHNKSNVQGGALSSGTRSLEAITNPDVYCNNVHLINGTWVNPRDNKLLLEAGVSTLINNRDMFTEPCGGLIYQNAIREQSTGLTYHGSGNRFSLYTYSTNQRFSATYLTGGHSIKAGETLYGWYTNETYTERGSTTSPVDYTFNNQSPTSLTEYVSPLLTNALVQPAIGAFIQDTWRLSRLTLNYGLRYEFIRGVAPALTEPTPIIGPPAASYPAQSCLPCWQDINPRLAAAYDVGGKGRTAIKGSFGRYVASANNENAFTFGPQGSQVTSTTRSWTDSNKNFVPDCDLTNPAMNLECGQMANTAFGTAVRNTTADPNWIKGWGKRGYNWRSTVEFDQQIGSSMAVNAGYYHTTWGNQTVTDNTLVTPSDYDPYCVTAPTDPKLGSVSGSQICGLYDINPTKFGQVNNVVTLAKNFGKFSEVYNGFDLNMSVRWHNGATAAGGWNIGNVVNTATVAGVSGLALGTNALTNQCFVVDSPQQLYHCQSGNPYQNRFKFNVSLPLNWGVQLGVVYQNLPGPNYDAVATFTSAQVQQSLNRPLAGGTKNVTVSLFVPNSTFLADRVNQLDLRFSKQFRVSRTRLQANFDLYNVFNDDAVLAVNSTYGTSWQTPTQVLDGRLAKFSFQIDF